MERASQLDVADYRALIASKAVSFEPRGFKDVPALNSVMFPHQVASTEFALRTGCAGLFLATGLGKSLCSLEWGRVVVERTNKPVLMLAPLAVAPQHQREAERFGIDAKAIRDPSAITSPRIYITNYERLHLFDASIFSGVIADEASILKAYTGSTSRAIRQAFSGTPYRLSATATPAPNDHMEIGQQCEFLGVMDAPEMLSRWFITDQTQMGKYRIKHAAARPFWDWVASWARAFDLPSDIGYDDDGFVLPPLVTHQHVVAADVTEDAGDERDGQGRLFRLPDTSATSIHGEKRRSVEDRADVIAAVVKREPGEAWVIWCDTDYEADAISARLPEAVEVRGSHSADLKEERLDAFSRGLTRIMISKPRIAGFGLNWQHCARVAFMGLSFSYEQYYQAIRRVWRFGQKRQVIVHVAMSETERSIWTVVSGKASRHDRMKDAMRAAMRRAHGTARLLDGYRPDRNVAIPHWFGATA